MIRKLLRQYATIDWVQRLVANELPLEDATNRYSGLMPPSAVHKLAHIQEGAEANPTPAQIADALRALNVFVRAEDFADKRYTDFAPAAHEHAGYVTKGELETAVKVLLAAVDKTVSGSEYAQYVARNKALEGYVTRRELTNDAVANMVAGRTGPLDADSVGGMSRERIEELIAERVSVAPQITDATIKGGVVRSGFYSPNPERGRYFRYANGGDHTLRAPKTKKNYTVEVLVDWRADAGVIRFEGFTAVQSGKDSVLRRPAGYQTLLTLKKLDEIVVLSHQDGGAHG